MNALLAHHFRQMVFGRSGFVYMAFGWVLAVLLVFVQGRFFAANEASLSTLFAYAPWVLALMLPALTMAVAEEPQRGLTERYLTLSLTPFARFAARVGLAKLLLGAWVLGFAPLVATVFYLGQPDVGPLLAGLFSLWVLAVVLYLFSLAVAFMARSAVVAFLGALALNCVLLAPGLGLVQAWGATLMPPALFAAVAGLSPLVAFQTLGQGHLLLSAILALLGWGFVGATLAFAAQPPCRPWEKPFRILTLAFTVLAALCFGGACLPVVAPLQLDATADQRFTLSPESTTLLRKLPQPLALTLYASRQNAEATPAQQHTIIALRRLMARIGAATPRVTVHEVDPDSSLHAAYAALEAGVDEQALPGGTGFFLGLAADGTLQDGTPRHGVLAQFAPERLPFAEFDVMSLIDSTLRPHQPTLMVWQGAGAASLKPALEGLTQLATVVPGAAVTEEIPSSTEAVLLVNDPVLASSTVAALKTYLATGGKVMLLAGEGDAAPAAPVSGTEPVVAEDALPFSRVLPFYGLNVRSNVAAADATQASVVAHTTGAGAYPFWLRLNARGVNAGLPFTTFVSRLVWPLGGVVEPTGDAPPGLRLKPVLTTSPAAKLVNRTAALQTGAEGASTLLANAEGRGPYWLGAVVSGKFVPGAEKPGTLLVFGGSRWLYPAFMKEGTGDGTTQNAALFYNSVQYLLGDGTLGTLRAKATLPRTLTRVEALLNGLTRSAAAQEQTLLAQQADVNALLETTPAGAQRVELLQKAFALRQNLRHVRQQTVQQIRLLEDALLLLNLLLMPLLLGVAVFAAKRL